MTTLTPKQERFCHEYMVDLNATQAAIRAGYSEKTAQEQASRLLSKVIVKTRISELQAEVAARTDVTIDDVIGMLRESYRDAKAVNQHGPAVRAAELLGKRHGMFTDVHKQADGEDLTPEEAITELCTQNGVLNVPAHDLFMQGLEALKKPMPPRNEEPTPPDPESGKPALEVVS